MILGYISDTHKPMSSENNKLYLPNYLYQNDPTKMSENGHNLWVSDDERQNIEDIFGNPRLQRRLQQYSEDYKDGLPDSPFVSKIFPSKESFAETLELLRMNDQTVSVLVPCANGKNRLVSTLKDMKPIEGLNLSASRDIQTIYTYDNSTDETQQRTGTRQLIEDAGLGKYLVKTEERIAEYTDVGLVNIPREAMHKGTNIYAYALDLAMQIPPDQWDKHYVCIMDEDANLSAIEVMQLSATAARKPSTQLTLQWGPRISHKGNENHDPTAGGRATVAFNALLRKSAGHHIAETPSDLAGNFMVRLGVLLKMKAFPHAYGFETALQYHVILNQKYQGGKLSDVLQFAAEATFHQIGQEDKSIRMNMINDSSTQAAFSEAVTRSNYGRAKLRQEMKDNEDIRLHPYGGNYPGVYYREYAVAGTNFGVDCQGTAKNPNDYIHQSEYTTGMRRAYHLPQIEKVIRNGVRKGIIQYT